MEYNNLNDDIYAQYRFAFIAQVEGVRPLPYYDTNKNRIPTIGIGFNLRVPEVLQDVVQAFGFDLNNAADQSYYAQIQAVLAGDLGSNANLQAQLDAIMQARATAEGSGRATFAFSTGADGQDEMRATFDQVVQDQETAVTNFYGAIHNSTERLALLSLKYTGVLERSIRAALNSGDRAEAWYDIQYASNRDRQHTARRYEEAALFGLYDANGPITLNEASDVYRMLALHRPSINRYDDQYGTLVAQANADLTAAQIPGVVAASAQTAFASAGAEIIEQLADQYGSLSALSPATYNPIHIYLNPGRSQAVTNGDATALDPAYAATLDAAGTSSDVILIASEGGANSLDPDLGNDALIAGSGDDVLIAGKGNDSLTGGSGADTLISGAGNALIHAGVGTNLLDFEFARNSAPSLAIEKVVDPYGKGSIIINGASIGGGLSRDPSHNDTWTDNQGRTYQFFSSDSPRAQSDANGTGFGAFTDYYPYIGELLITPSQADSSGVGAIELFGFNVEAAENSPGGFLGIVVPKKPSITAGSNAGFDPPPPDFTAGTSQSYTVWLDAPAATAQTVTLTLAGLSFGAFGLDTGSGLQTLSSGTFAITIAAGETSASFTLVNTAAAGADGQTMQLTATVADPTDPNATSVSSDPLLQSYVEPTPDPFNTGTAGTIAGQVENAGNTTYTSYTGDGADDLIAAGSGVNYILGGAGKDLITGGGGNGVIWTGNGNSHIYAGSQVDLQTAIDTEGSAAAAMGQGYLLAVGDGDNTIVGGSGNELIMTGDGNNLIVAGANDTVHSGVAVTGASLDWITSGSGSVGLSQQNITFNFNGLSWVAEGGPVPPGYEGNGEEISGGHIVGTGNDTIFGGTGHGQFWLSNGNNYVAAGAGNDEIIGGMGSNTIMGGTGNISVLGGGGSDYIAGGSGSDLLIGRGGDNTIIGGSGNDTLFAGNVPLSPGASDWATSETGNNYIDGSSGNDQIFGAGGHDTLIGGTGNVSIYGGAGTELIIGGSGNDLLTGGAGNDTIEAGGGGNDTLIAAGSSGNTSVVYGGSGTDSLQGGLGTNILYAGDGGVAGAPTTVVAGADSSSTNTLYGGAGVDVLEGGAGSNVIYAGDGGSATDPTTIVAGSGTTTVYGGLGIDFIQGGTGSDVLYAGDGGTDVAPTTVIAGTGTTTLSGGAGTAILKDSVDGSDVLLAGSGDDTLVGSGADTLVAGAGSDYLNGISGNVTYEIGANSGDVLISGLGSLVFDSGVDPTDLSVTATLSSDGSPAMEIDGAGCVTIMGGLSGGISGVRFADSGALSLNQLVAADGVDDTIVAANGNLVFDVESGNNITGGTGADTLSAWGAQDTMTGGLVGTLILAEGAGDQILGGNGSDTVVAAGDDDSITAGAIGDRITATGQSDQIFGGAGYDTIVASGDHDTITAGNGSDQISVTGANASIIGGWGNDTLIAAGHDDTIVGGFGTETFVVQDSSTVINPSLGFEDTILSSVSYVLSAAVTTLTLTGSEDLTATDAYGYATITGNAGHDTLIGGSGLDVLVAGSGIDTLIGGSGYTRFEVNNAADVIEMGTGRGDLQSSVSYSLVPGLDTLTLTGTADLIGTGNADATNFITGNAGNDTLVAGSGSDTLIAGSGIDTLVAGTGTDFLSGTNGDTFAFNAGSGHAEVFVSSGQGTLEFGPGIAASNLTLGATLDQYGNPSLVIEGTSAITVDGGLVGSIGAFDFADGTHDSLAQLLNAASISSSTISGAFGNLVFNGAAGASLAGGVGQDTLFGLGSSDTVVAGSGNQILYGFGDDAVLAGSVGSDTLHGGVGNDTLIGGTGTTVMDGGQGNDFYMLTAGGTALIDPSDSPGTEVLYLPDGMSYSDFTAHESSDGDLVLKANSGGTFATIKGFYLPTSPPKTWVLADDSDLPQFLTYWLSSTNQIPHGSTYSEQIEQLRATYAAKLGGTLQAIGSRGGTLTDPTSTVPFDPNYNYEFKGVSTRNLTVQGGMLTIPTSDDVEYSYSTTTTTITQDIQTPTYGMVTIAQRPTVVLPVDQASGGGTNNSPDPTVFQPVYGSGGQVTGYAFTMPATLRTVQTGYVTTTETIQVNTTTTQETQAITAYNITGDGGNDVISATGPFVGTVVTGNGNVRVDLGEGAQYVFNSGAVPPDYATGAMVYLWTGSAPRSGPSEPVGAFIEVGSGNDTIWGTENGTSESVGGGNWSSDVIAAGTGFDYLNGSLGTTYYVPMSGYSTEVIGDPAVAELVDYAPPTTLVLPNGISPADLTYRVFEEPDSGSEILQLKYGTSDVLVNYDPWSPSAGVTSFQFADGTLLSRDQLIAQATLLPNDFNPIVTAQNPNWNSGEGITAASLFTVTDSPADTATWFRFENSGTGGGYFVLNDQVEASGQSFMVNASQLAQLEYVSGNDASSDQIQVSAFDGAMWSAPASLTVTAAGGTAAAGALPVVIGTAQAQTLSGGPGSAFVASPMGDDTFITGAGHNVVAFNSFDGQDTIIGAPGGSNVLSLGEIDVENLSFSKNGNDLILSDPAGDSLAFQNWYSDSAYHDFFALQAIDSNDYNPQGSDPLHQNIIERFNFGQLVDQFDAARQSDPTLSSWQLSAGLATAYVGGSDTQALGGDLAYYYSENRGLAGMNLSAAQAVVQDSQYGITPQTVHPWTDISGGAVHL